MTDHSEREKAGRPADDPLNVIIGQNLRYLRIRSRLTQEDAAVLIGVSHATMHCYEIGRIRISASSLYRLSAAFDCSIIEFFRDVPEGVALLANDVENDAAAASLSRITDDGLRQRIIDLINAVSKIE